MALEVHLLWHALNLSCSFCASGSFDEEAVPEIDAGGTPETRGGPDRFDGAPDSLIEASDSGADSSVIEGEELLGLSKESLLSCIDSPSRHDKATKSIKKIIEKINSDEDDIFIIKTIKFIKFSITVF